MSGFAGVVNADGAPVSRAILERMRQSLAFRGPDGQQASIFESAGLVHAALHIDDGRTTRQPANMEQRVWIVADARIDARADLIKKLRSESPVGVEVSLATPDVELILHAYAAWGESCVEHLLGDFAFAIWDVPNQSLFCARDHFGVKLFYYSLLGPTFLFSNTLNSLRQHPSVSGNLNELAIADYLLFDVNQDWTSTSFVDIQMLPPGHTLTFRNGEFAVRRYWQLSGTEPIRFGRDEEYIERFRELLDAAVSDRMRSGNAAVLMSGGLDSSTIAASAKRVLARRGLATGLRAYTQVYDRLIRDEERHYAAQVARELQIPIEFTCADQLRIFEDAEQGAPDLVSLTVPKSADPLHSIGQIRRTVFTGDGGDPAFSARLSVHFRELYLRRQFGKAARDATRYLSREGRLSRLYLRIRWERLFGGKEEWDPYPTWLNEDFETRLRLRDRWEASKIEHDYTGSVRPEAMRAMTSKLWSRQFQFYDPSFTGIPVELCHPFFDVRLVEFLVALPRLPWCCDKQLLRDAGFELPRSVRLRPKSPMAADPLVEVLKHPASAWVDEFDPEPELEQYVIRARIPRVCGGDDCWANWMNLRPLSLNFWLRHIKNSDSLAAVGAQSGSAILPSNE